MCSYKKDKEYYNIIKEILNSDEFQKRKKYKHHEDSVYDHCLEVSYMAYKYSKKHKLDYKAAAIGGLLHDFYKKPWQENTEKKKFFQKHGFVHAQEALENAKKYYPLYINKKVEDIILRHMFPLNIKPPKYKESWVVTMCDKKASLTVFKHPSKYGNYIGIRRKKK